MSGDKKISELEPVTTILGNALIPIVVVSGQTKTNKYITLKNFLASLSSNTVVLENLIVKENVSFEGDTLTTQTSNNNIQGTTHLSHLVVANSHIELLGTFTPASSTLSTPLDSNVQIFVDADYLYVAVNGTAKRIALDSF